MTKLAATAASAAADPVLFGDQTAESGIDYNSAGLAEAFQARNGVNGTTATISVYVDSSSSATKLYAGVYADNSGHPGSLVASGSLSSPKAGSWNNVTVPSTAVGAGNTYWIAVLGTGGTLRFRDRDNGPCTSETSSQTTLSLLPSSWKTGRHYTTCPISAYVNGYLTSSSTSTAAPTVTTPPAISGSTVQGQTLSTTNGSWTGSPTSYAYQWRQCDSTGNGCTDISSARSSSYTLASGDVGHTLRAVVTATNAGGTTPATAAQTAGVTAPQSSNANCAGTNGSGVVSQSSLDACGLPSMNTTGPVAGTTFTNSSGFTASTPGAVYNGLNVNGEISITASNVTIQNSNITAVDPNTAAIKVASGVTGVKIVNDSIHGTNAVQSGSLAFAVSYFGSSITGVTIDHTNFYNGDRILAGYGTVTNSYCLGGAVFTTGGYTEHDECIYTDGGAPGIRVIHDALLVDNGQTAAIFVDNPDYGGGGVDGTLDVENSLLAGGGYCVYGGDGTSRPHTGPVTIKNNRFSRLFFSNCGQYGTNAHFTDSVTTWSGNVWDDTNKAASP